MRRVLVAIVGLTMVGALVTACSDDDGGGVRSIGCDASGSGSSGSGSGSSSGSGSGTSSGSGSSGSGSASTDCPTGSGSGAASGSTTAAECEPVGDSSTAATTVEVGLDEWVIEVGAPSTTAGTVTFNARNRGKEPHELVVLKGVEAGALPLDADGALDESKLPDGALVGEVEPFPAGETCDGTFTLDAAEYVFVCNITETEADGTVESHLAEGMLTTFTVT